MWFYVFSLLVIQNFYCFQCFNESTLVLTHVMFRHGERTPSRSGLWKTNKYYNESFYEPYGYGQLTNKGKMTAYKLGVALRNRYSNFLGDVWNMDVQDAWSTDNDRTKMSALLVLGGLFPPKDPVIWNDQILWQSIPYRYLPEAQDKELSSWACATTVPLIYGNSSNMKRLQSYDGLIKTLSENIGEEVDYISALYLYFGMYIQNELGFPLDNWTQAIFPEPFKTYVVDFYYIETSTKDLKKVVAGYFIKKLLTDTINKINGTLDPQDRKIFLYSGHETNLGTVIAALEVYDLIDPPPYGSYLLFEVHNIDGVYGIEMYYDDNKGNTPYPLTLPGCQKFCPIDDFARLTADIIPKSDAECNGD